MEVVVWQPNTNWGNTASLIKNYYSVAFRGSQSDVGPFHEDAIVYGINEDLLRVYKVSTNNYELQARSDDDNRDLVVEYTITSKNNAKVTPNDSYTAATTSGGTAYTASANSNTKTKFAGELEFQGTTIGDDLRVNGNLFFGTGADTTYGGFLTQHGGADHGISMTVEDTDGFVINTVYGNAGEAYQSFSITDTIELKDSNETLLEVSLNKIDISAPTEISIGETEVGLAVYTTNVSTTPNVKFGRNAAEYIGFITNDLYNEIIFRQDEPSSNHQAILDLWTSTTGNASFIIRKSNQSGGSSSNWMVIENGDTTFSGDVDINGGDLTIAKQNDAPTMTLLHDGTNPSTNDLLFRMQFQSDYDGSHQNWGKIELDTNASSVRTNMDFYVKSQSGNEQIGLRLEGGSAEPNAIFYNKLGLNGDTPAYTIDTGETTIGTLRMVGDVNHTFIRLGAGGGGNDVTLIRIDGDSTDDKHDGETDAGAYGFSLKYLGSLSSNENALALYADNQTAASQVESFRVKQDGTLHIAQNATFSGDVLPDTDSANDLGSTSLRWANVWADNINGGSPLDGSGQADRIAFWTDSNTISYNSNLRYDEANQRVGIGSTPPDAKLTITSSNGDENRTLKINHTRNDADTGTNALQIDANFSGTKQQQPIQHKLEFILIFIQVLMALLVMRLEVMVYTLTLDLLG